MVTRQATTTVRFTFSELSFEVVRLGRQKQLATEVMLSWTTDDPPLEDEDSPFLNYDILGFECNDDGSICKWCRGGRDIRFSTALEQWLFLSKLADTIDHPEIQAELARRVAQVNREMA